MRYGDSAAGPARDAAAIIGVLFTSVLPELSGRTLEEISGEDEPVLPARKLAQVPA